MNNRTSSSLLYRTAVLAVAFIMATFPSTAVFAFDEIFYSSNDILYYDPDSGCVSSSGGYTTRMDLPTLVGNDNAEKIWNFFIEEGLSKKQAAGVMGNIAQESNFDPTAIEDNGVGFGIVQWSYERRNGYDKDNQNTGEPPIGGIEKAAEDHGVSVTDLGFQLAYLVQESQGREVDSFVTSREYYRSNFGEIGDNEWETLKQQETTEDAMLFFHASFEKSNDSYEEIMERRGKFAENAYVAFKDMVPTGLPASNTPTHNSNDCAPFSGGDIQSLVMEYAWPEHHEAPHLEMRPAYEAAVKDGQEKGYNVGGGIHPGIDCAGFVNLLIVNSGFDPSYNFNGKGNDSAGRTGEAQHRKWMFDNWEYLGEGGTGGQALSTADLLPGDVAVSTEEVSFRLQHIFIYVGQIDGFSSQFASASYLSWRTPMAAGSGQIGASGNPVGDYENVTSADYIWFRKK